MPHTTFDNYGLPAKLTHALTRIQFTTPTPIQAQAIPLALEGKDILGSAQTGTGKTGAFGIPIIAGLMANSEATALIMTPTRELAGQVIAALESMIPVPDIRTALLIGGESMPKQLHQLNHHPRMVVGTPGRINDHLERGSLKLNNVRYLVLDETDRMLDMGFGIQIERILKHVPSDRQTLLFSATLPGNIVKLSSKYMRNPVRIAVGSTTTPLEKIKQEMIQVTDAEKYGKLIEQIKTRKGSIIVFTKTKWGAQKLSDRLNKDGHRSDAIHGNLQQRRRDRVIQHFRDERYRILVATDVAARGLDIPHIAHVINYDVPMAPEDYIHRIGRTARAGAEGEAISFVTSGDGLKWRAIQRLIKGEDANASSSFRGGEPRRSGKGGKRRRFWKRDGKRSYGEKPRDDRPVGDKPRSGEHFHADRPRGERPHGDRPRGERPHGDKPKSDRPYGDKPRDDRPHSDRPRGERPHGDKPKSDRPYGDKPRGERPYGRYAQGDRPHYDQPSGERRTDNKPRHDRPLKAKYHGGGKNYVHKAKPKTV